MIKNFSLESQEESGSFVRQTCDPGQWGWVLERRLVSRESVRQFELLGVASHVEGAQSGCYQLTFAEVPPHYHRPVQSPRPRSFAVVHFDHLWRERYVRYEIFFVLFYIDTIYESIWDMYIESVWESMLGRETIIDISSAQVSHTVPFIIPSSLSSGVRSRCCLWSGRWSWSAGAPVEPPPEPERPSQPELNSSLTLRAASEQPSRTHTLPLILTFTRFYNFSFRNQLSFAEFKIVFFKYLILR